MLLDQLIDRQALVAEARKSGLDKDPPFRGRWPRPPTGRCKPR